MTIKDELKGKIKSVIEISYKAINCDSGEVVKGEREWKHANSRDSQKKYDENKNMVEKNSYFSDGSLDYKWTYEYDKSGNMVEENDYPEGVLITRYAYQYDDAGNMTEESDFDSNGKLFDKYSYKYDGKNLIEEINYDSDGSVIFRSAYKYDKSGNLIEKNEYNSKGGLSDTSTYAYDDKDNMTKKGGTSSNACRWTYSYDKDGNMFEKFRYDCDDRLREKFTYSKNVIERIQTDYEMNQHRLPDDEVRERTKEIITTNDNGNIIERKEYTFEGRFICYLTRTTTYEYKYDEKGNWIERIQSENDTPQYITEREYEYYD